MKREQRHGDDLRVRTKQFGGAIVRFFVSLDKTREELRVLGKQLLRSGTSVGAQYREASRARSDEEFTAKIDACTQEADESQYCLAGSRQSRPAGLHFMQASPSAPALRGWIELLRDDCGVSSAQTDPLWQEADELISIFVTMSKRTKEKRS